jgi:hypothetical protein
MRKHAHARARENAGTRTAVAATAPASAQLRASHLRGATVVNDTYSGQESKGYGCGGELRRSEAQGDEDGHQAAHLQRKLLLWGNDLDVELFEDVDFLNKRHLAHL